MNDRIEKLSEQADDYADDYLGTPGEFHPNWHTVRDNKFAELIVREHLAVWEAMDNGNAVEGYLEMEDYPLAISKRFGIEELLGYNIKVVGND